MKIQTRVLSLVLGLVGLACPLAVFPQGTLQPPAEQSASSFSDSELKSFAVAVLEVQRINDTFVPKLESAKSPEEQQKLRKTASQEMVRAVEKEGMSVDKYKEIMSQTEANPAVAERVKEHMRSTDKVNPDK
ncbi:MAG: DUF4168 domain-containing protein [Betaproteobacteria bacterium]|nr:DUF4168 domain-containing protein [Betaproteobacteria bacterium]